MSMVLEQAYERGLREHSNLNRTMQQEAEESRTGRSVECALLNKYSWNYQIEKDVMGYTCSTTGK